MLNKTKTYQAVVVKTLCALIAVFMLMLPFNKAQASFHGKQGFYGNPSLSKKYTKKRATRKAIKRTRKATSRKRYGKRKYSKRRYGKRRYSKRRYSKRRYRGKRRVAKRSRTKTVQRARSTATSFTPQRNFQNSAPSLSGARVAATRGTYTGCFPAKLRSLLNQVSAHYGRKVIITSGHRSYRHNRRVGGARKSYHVKCMAADIRIDGVNKYALARYLKTLPGRGGVGVYGCNRSVHLDVGPRRSWHWGCGKKRRKRFARKRSRRR